MRGKEKEQNWLIVSIIGYFLISVAILLVPFSDVIGVWIAGTLFWLSLILTVLGQVILARNRRRWIARYRVKDPKILKSNIGIFSFVKNIPAIIADSILLISIIAMIIAFVATNGTGYSCYITLALVMFSFSMHCIFNGKIYYYVVNRDLVVKNGKRLDLKKE